MRVDIPEDIVQMLEGTPFYAESQGEETAQVFVIVTPRELKGSSPEARSQGAYVIASDREGLPRRVRLFANGGAVSLEIRATHDETWEDMLRLGVQRLLLGEMYE
jgi:hypothetical protein